MGFTAEDHYSPWTGRLSDTGYLPIVIAGTHLQLSAEWAEAIVT